VAALRAFALLDREIIPDERDPTISTNCIRLHRLVRQIAAREREEAALSRLTEAMAAVYPPNIWRDPETWPRLRRLEPLTIALVGTEAIPRGLKGVAADLLYFTGQYRRYGLADNDQAKVLYERALAIREEIFGADHHETARIINSLALLLKDQGDLAGAQRFQERDLAITEKALGPDHPDTAASLDNLAQLLKQQNDLAAAEPLYERALAIRERVLGSENPGTATTLSNLARLLHAKGDFERALSLSKRAAAINEKVLGPDHPHTAATLNALAFVMAKLGDVHGARELLKRALAINEKALGSDHPITANSLVDLGGLLDASAALPLYERALQVNEKTRGVTHSSTLGCASLAAAALSLLGRTNEAKALCERYGIKISVV
jgi:tetratricopeptide (TPR) repeat protein